MGAVSASLALAASRLPVCQTDCQCKVPEEENTLLGEGEEEGSKRSVDTGWEGAFQIMYD